MHIDAAHLYALQHCCIYPQMLRHIYRMGQNLWNYLAAVPCNNIKQVASF